MGRDWWVSKTIDTGSAPLEVLARCAKARTVGVYFIRSLKVVQ
jgi:hypothetical protein